ncbi:putative ribonuclease H-like domain-containing protein [Tanacetum coccineum]
MSTIVVKDLYGLHQAHRAGLERLSAFLLQHNYRRGTIDKTLFIKKDSRDILLVQVYVDDIIFGSTNKAWCEEFEVLMQGEFEMSAMGEMSFFLGLQFDMESVRSATTPYEAAKTKLKDESDPPVNVHLYRSMIGSLMYLTASRPDIMFAACGTPKISSSVEAYETVIMLRSHGDRKSTRVDFNFGQAVNFMAVQEDSYCVYFSTEPRYVAVELLCTSTLDSEPIAGLWIQLHEYQNLHRQPEHHLHCEEPSLSSEDQAY